MDKVCKDALTYRWMRYLNLLFTGDTNNRTYSMYDVYLVKCGRIRPILCIILYDCMYVILFVCKLMFFSGIRDAVHVVLLNNFFCRTE